MTKDRLIVTPLPGYPPEIGRALWMLEDVRARTRRALEDFDPAAVDTLPPGCPHSAGTLLYHVAAIELDWLYTDVLGQDWPPGIDALFPHDVRTADGHLTTVTGESMAAHWSRLSRVRTLLLDGFKSITVDDFRRPRNLEHYDVTPEWVLHHLGQHEAEHRAELTALHRHLQFSKPTG